MSCTTGVGAKINPDLNSHSPSLYGWNIGAAELLDPVTVQCRLATYLNEIVAHGYQRQARIIYPPDWGPFVLKHWIPVIRQHNFRVLIILSQSLEDRDLTKQRVWIQTGIPPVVDILDGIQPANEPDGKSSPEEYAIWHHQIVELLKQNLPMYLIPVVGPDLHGGSYKWIARTDLIYGQDYNIVSIHAQKETTAKGLMALREAAFEASPNARVWLTESDWGQTPWFNEHGLPVERTYVYVWNGNEAETRRPGGNQLPC